eukprot:TRINITY_DN43205_c0_g1_i1.p1 TRINITY_DN43205_c0_g1~~TRINITY_DN43205_c0_g1_i1.p1  ORF type:complete len:399 (+),score=65.63 TRINITY_DN43205_c0_g1_i1:38-1234(+)
MAGGSPKTKKKPLVTGFKPDQLEFGSSAQAAGSHVGDSALSRSAYFIFSRGHKIALILVIVIGYGLRSQPARVTEEMVSAPGHRSVRRMDGSYEDGRLIEYRVAGDFESNEVVVFVHGWLSSVKAFRLYEAAAKKRKLKMITVGIPGFGLSEGYPVGQLRGLMDFGSDVVACVEAEGARDFHLVGYSEGALHAIAAAFGNAKHVRNLLLLAPAMPSSVEGMVEGQAWASNQVKHILTMPVVGEALAWLIAKGKTTKQRMSNSPDVKAAVEKFSKDGSGIAQAIYDDQDYALHHTWRGIALENAHLLCTYPLPFDISDIASVNGSVAVSFATDDTSTPPAMSKWYCDQIPGCKLLEHPPGYGHLFHLHAANVPRILDFVKTGQDGAADAKAFQAAVGVV